MQDRDKPLGQHRGDGHIFGSPFFVRTRERSNDSSSDDHKRESHGWLDRVGQPHGRTGDKLTRKAMTGTVGLRHGRGPYAAWALTARPGKSKRREK